MSDFVIRINRGVGSLEVSGEDKEWVDQKIAQLEFVYRDAPQALATSYATNSKELILPASTSKGRGTETKTARKPSSAKRPEINPVLKAKLTRDVMVKLQTFINERKKAFDSSLPAQAIIITIFLEDELHWKGIDRHDLLTVYRELGMANGETGSQLRNAYNRNKYFSNVEDGKYLPSTAGDSFARFGSKDA